MSTPRQDDDREGTTRRGLLGAAVLVLVLLFALAGLQSWRDLSVARSRSQNLQDQVQATEQRIESLRERIHRLETDPRALERLAREELGLVRPGDLVIVLPQEDDPREASRLPREHPGDPSAPLPASRTDPAPPSAGPPGPE